MKCMRSVTSLSFSQQLKEFGHIASDAFFFCDGLTTFVSYTLYEMQNTINQRKGIWGEKHEQD